MEPRASTTSSTTSRRLRGAQKKVASSGSQGAARLALLAAIGLALTACGDDARPPPETSGEGGGGGAGGDGGRADPTGFELGEPEILARDQAFPVRLAIDGETLYFANRGGPTEPSGAVLSLPKLGGVPEIIAEMQVSPSSIAVLDGTVYWSTIGNPAAPGAIRWWSPGGAVASVSPIDQPIDVAPDADGVYWIERITGALVWAPWGGAAQTLASDLLAPIRLLDGGDRIFAVEEGPEEAEQQGRVRAWSKRDHAEETIAAGLARPQAAALHGGELFVTCSGDGTVKAVQLADRSERVLATGQDMPWGIAVDAVNVYFTNRPGTPECNSDEGTLNSVPIAGGPVKTLASGLRCPSTIAVDDTGVYWVVNGSAEPIGDGTVRRLPKQYH
jgi:hypothetical protein